MKKNLILIVAALLVFLGCSTDYEILKSQENISLTADFSSRLIRETITFSVKNAKGDDFTAESEIFVNGAKIEGNTFTSEVLGSFEVTAKYNGVTSAPLLVTFDDVPQINFRKRMLVEDYTGTWCGYCPRVAWGIELLHEQTEDAVAVAIHRPSSTVSSAVYDPYNFPEAAELEATLNAAGYPKGFLNRTERWANPEPDNIAQAIALTQGTNPKMGLAMTSTIANGNITMDVNVMFGKDFSNNLKLVVYVLENGLIYDQHNYTSYYNDEDILAGYTHNHVLRACLTPILGEAISNTQTKTGETYKRAFNVSVPANIANQANVEFVAFVIDETGKVVNVRKSAPGETQEMELL